ncbi:MULTISPECIES: hypothetical protein [unclassified Lentimonas]|nr:MULTISPECIES: hypothetical protein [unclassified Lentimonas]
MCRGWALGSKKFKCDLLESEGLLKDGSFEKVRMEGQDLREVNELIWESVVARGLEHAEKTSTSLKTDKKSAEWKVRIAAELKRTTSAPSTWIAQKLHMGAPQLVGIYIKQWERDNDGLKQK